MNDVHPTPPAPPAPPLLVTGDPALRDALLRLAAEAGAEIEVAEDDTTALSSWGAAPLVIVGADRASDLVAAPVSRRPGVLLLTADRDDAGVWDRAVRLGAEAVLVLPDAEWFLLDRIAEATGAAPRGRVVAVIGARGGAGATSLAVALALAAARHRRRVMLVDADPFGGGIDLALGAEEAAGPRWDALAASPPRFTGKSLLAALPRCGDVTVLAWPRDGAPVIPRTHMTAVIAAARRGAELVVVDVARSFDDAAQVVLSMADVVLMVCPAELRACVAGGRIADTVRLFNDDVRVVVRGPAPTGLDAATVAETLALPLAGAVEEEPGIAVALDEGRPPGRAGVGPLATLSDMLLTELLP